jgi:hypothetical protein
MADDLNDMQRKLGDLARSLENPKVNRAVADLGRRDILAELDADLPGRRFRRWGVVMDIRVDGSSPARISGYPLAPWKVLDVGRSPGTNGHVSWGATRGKGTWQDGSAKVADESPKRVDDEVRQILHRIY